MLRFVLSLIIACIGFTDAWAHPHVLVEARVKIHINEKKEIARVSHEWTFDESFSTFALQGLAKNSDGTPTEAALKPLADVNIKSMKDYAYFTFMAENTGGKYKDYKVQLTPATGHFLTFANKKLTLHFDMIFVTPVLLTSNTFALDVYDPEYFVAFTVAKDAVSIVQPEATKCSVKLAEPKKLDDATAKTLAQIPADMRELPPELADMTAELANRMALSCL